MIRKNVVSAVLLICCLLLASCTTKSADVYNWDDSKLYDSSLLGKKVTIEFVVVSSYNPGTICYLNSHLDYKTYLTAVIPSDALSKFASKPEDYYLNEKIKVTGILGGSGRPQIIIEDPLQIEIL
ncbi:MAG: hypothetical protein RAP41_04420 [Candidatus Orphnella occulta]|nr:hypothetical protein [Candidatus Orphnella occulta]